MPQVITLGMLSSVSLKKNADPEGLRRRHCILPVKGASRFRWCVLNRISLRPSAYLCGLCVENGPLTQRYAEGRRENSRFVSPGVVSYGCSERLIKQPRTKL